MKKYKKWKKDENNENNENNKIQTIQVIRNTLQYRVRLTPSHGMETMSRKASSFVPSQGDHRRYIRVR